ncbi:hypothetical protein FALCPG4_015014 [Fusarium falciforme]
MLANHFFSSSDGGGPDDDDADAPAAAADAAADDGNAEAPVSAVLRRLLPVHRHVAMHLGQALRAVAAFAAAAGYAAIAVKEGKTFDRPAWGVSGSVSAALLLKLVNRQQIVCREKLEGRLQRFPGQPMRLGP